MNETVEDITVLNNKQCICRGVSGKKNCRFNTSSFNKWLFSLY